MGPAFDARYKSAFVGDSRRPGAEACGNENGMEDQPEPSITDEQVNGEIEMARMDASRNSQRQMESKETLELLQG